MNGVNDSSAMLQGEGGPFFSVGWTSENLEVKGREPNGGGFGALMLMVWRLGSLWWWGGGTEKLKVEG